MSQMEYTPMLKPIWQHDPTISDSGVIPRYKKQRYIKGLLEDSFRDDVVRPVLERQGLTFLRHTCGSDEEGKDCLFETLGPLDRRLIYAVQTKRGDLNMSRSAGNNTVEARTQVITALETDVVVDENKTKRRPDYVYLIASGIINVTIQPRAMA